MSIGVDTNVLLRLVMDDDADQSPAARRLIERAAAAGEAARVDRIVLCEAVWTLVRRDRFSRGRVADALEAWIRAPALDIEDRELVATAAAVFRRSRADFADILIGLVNRRAGCATTYTFDRAATELDTFTTVPLA